MLSEKVKFLVENFMESIEEEFSKDTNGENYKNLLEVEKLAGEISQKVGNNILSRFTSTRSGQISGPEYNCEKCGTKMKRHRKDAWEYNTTFGNINVDNDVYLYCEDCGHSARPLHSFLGTQRVKLSLPLEKTIVDFAIDESGRKAAGKIMRHYPNVMMDSAKALRILHKHGEKAKQFIVDKLNGVFNSKEREENIEYALELEVEYDGGMIPVAVLEEIEAEGEAEELMERTPVRNLPKRRKNCRWEEVKVGIVQKSKEDGERLYTVRHKDELVESFEDLLALAHIKNWSEDTNVRGIADGARYIKKRMRKTFTDCDFKFILDRPHAKEHLHKAGEALAMATNIDARKWAEEALFLLENGMTDDVVQELRGAGKNEGIDREAEEILLREANYFEYNQDSVAYAQYREKGWSTASSEVESAHRHVVQARLKIPGAWWHPNNVPNILALRMIKANNWWDEYWEEQEKVWLEKAEDLKTER